MAVGQGSVARAYLFISRRRTFSEGEVALKNLPLYWETLVIVTS